MDRRFTRVSAVVAAHSRPAAALAALAVAFSPLLAAGSASAASPAAGSGPSGAVDAISCTSAGQCTALGVLGPANPKVLFSVTEKNGVWGTSRAVPGVRALLGSHNPFGVDIESLSCSSTGNCAAGGFYGPSASSIQGLVVSEKSGTWGKAEAVPGLAALNVGRNAEVDSISCASAGNCSAGGIYTVKSANILASSEVFLASEKNGVWGKAEEVPGTAKLNTGTDGSFDQVDCTSAGNCLAVGSYKVKGDSDDIQAFFITEKNGKWGTAKAVPGFAQLGDGAIIAISCASAGNCTGVGNSLKSGVTTVFAISMKNGTWGAFTPIPGMAALPPDGSINADLSSLACPSAGNCTAAGGYNDPSSVSRTEPFVVTEKNGTWGNAETLPGVAALSPSPSGTIPGSVVCPSAGNCAATGAFFIHNGTQAFVSTEKNGTWSSAIELPGIAALNKAGDADTPRLSCGAPGNCGIGGFYGLHTTPGHQLLKPYLGTLQNGAWSKAKEVGGIS